MANELKKYTAGELPATIEELKDFIMIGNEYVHANQSLLKAIEKSKGKESRLFLDKLTETQTVAEVMIEAMAKMGGMLADGGQKNIDRNSQGRITGRGSLPPGILTKQSHYAQEIFKHPDIVEEVELRQRQLKNVVSWNHIYREIKARENAPPLIIDGMYRIIYADPPWKYGNMMSDNFTEQGTYYPLMTIKEICEIDIKNHISPNAVLFLWVTWPILEDSFKVIKAWGFKYKTGWTWDKIKHVMGHYNSVRSELLLFAVKGSCPLENKKLFDNVVSIERTNHSEKPKYFRDMIDTLYPSGKAAEIFYRGDKSDLSERWDAYGNEISR